MFTLLRYLAEGSKAQAKDEVHRDSVTDQLVAVDFAQIPSSTSLTHQLHLTSSVSKTVSIAISRDNGVLSEASTLGYDERFQAMLPSPS